MTLKSWRCYRNCLNAHPLKTQAVSSGLIWGTGDVCAQSINHSASKNHQQNEDGDKDNELQIDFRRAATTALFGLGFVGPVGHFWYEGLDQLIRKRLSLRPNTLHFVATKVAIDGYLFGPIDLLVFFSYTGLTLGKSFDQIKEDMKRDFVPSFILEGSVMPFFQMVNFRFVPVRYQLLFSNMFCLVDSSFLSWVVQQHDAPFKKWIRSILNSNEQEKQ